MSLRISLGLAVAVAGCAGLQSPQPIRTFEYDWLTQGVPSGAQRVQHYADGRIVVDFQFTDRGRGPRVSQTLRFDPGGALAGSRVEGRSYLGAAVDEEFSLRDGVATWRSTRERGELTVAGPAFYAAAEGTPEELAALARAALQRPDGRLPLLPSGEVRIEAVHSMEADDGTQRRPVTLYALSGLDFTPTYVWLDAAHQLFALDGGWMGLTPKGWAAALPELARAQRAASTAYFRERARVLTRPLPDPTLIRNVHVLDVVAGRRSGPTEVAVAGGRIVALGAKARRLKAALVVDGAGGTLLPGLWDMHGHLRIEHGILNIAAGVTSVRDMANDDAQLGEVIGQFDRGEVIGPRVYRAGFIDQKGPFAAPTGKLAATLEEALGFVDWYAERGYRHIKIYSSITPAWVRPLADHAHRRGLRISGHVPAGMTAEQAVRDGFDEIQHLNMLFLNFLAGPNDDTRTPLRFTLVAQRGRELDLDGAPVRSFVELLRQRGTVVDPTVTIFRSMFLRKDGVLDPAYAAVADHLPSNVRRGLLGGALPITPANEAAYAESAEALLRFVKRLHDAGVPLVAGTDAIPGFALHSELELYVQAGIPPADVLRLATLGSARVVGEDRRSGSVTVGKDADLVLVDGDPLRDIGDLRRVRWTLKDGRLYDSSALYAAVGVAPFVTPLTASR